MGGSGKQRKQVESRTGSTMPLGVSCVGEDYYFAVFLPGVKQCGLKIYDLDRGGEATASLSLFAQEERPGVFSISIPKKGLPVHWGYRYIAGDIEFTDPYTKYTKGREVFGVPGKTFGMAAESDDKKTFAWGADKPPRLAYEDMILYKLNIRGFTMAAPGVRHPGTYLGLLEKKKYLLDLGVNAVLLLPCVEFDEVIRGDAGYQSLPYTARLAARREKEQGEEKCRVNLWGFGAESLYFAPKASYASDPSHAGREFKQMVKGLHEGGVEVLMEMDFKPTDSPAMILDCLSWWVSEYHIDGFRIGAGLLPTRFFTENPVFAGVKFISQGFDGNAVSGAFSRFGHGGRTRYQAVLAEYNDGFLSEIRRFVKGDEEMAGCVAARLERQSGGGIGVINYIADNNGFTLHDLYSYDVKHNAANGEDGRDGSDYNFSWNCGVEGPTKKKKILKLRAQMRRNALALLFFAQGTPMLLAGDEFGNSQDGNNNTYCQDNETGWVSWQGLRREKELFLFVKSLIALRKAHPVLHNKIPLKGMDYLSCGCPDISRHGTKAWYPDYSNYSRTIALLLCGCYAKTGQETSDCSFYLAANMHWEPHDFALPVINNGETLAFLLATSPEAAAPGADNTEGAPDVTADGNGARTFTVPPRSVVLFVGKQEEVRQGKRRGRKTRREHPKGREELMDANGRKPVPEKEIHDASGSRAQEQPEKETRESTNESGDKGERK